EDPLQFFRRLSSLSNGEPEGERESQDLFMSYTQALLLKEAGDYAAASTLFRLMRNYKSLEVEAQYHLAQCLLLLDPDLRCFGDEIVVALERVCSTSSAELLDAGAWDKMQRVSMELLAHVLASQGHFERARSMLRALRGGNQYEEQESVLGFQTALCELALGDLDAAHTQLARVDCRASLPLVHVDARAVERALVLSQRRRRTMSSASDAEQRSSCDSGGEDEPPREADTAPRCYFSICGMMDGVADVLAISADDDWTLTPVAVEVKNRVRTFRDPPPLHDHVQMAVYMKMLGLAQGDLVYAPDESGGDGAGHGDLWTDVILPRLYQYTALLHKVRSDDLLRLAFLSGTAAERLEMLQRECGFL
ncbi:hypothetical protein PybrP1_003437, partial [[Pythium] brassicae (nom. inval.)]